MTAPTPSASARSSLAPTGTLRVGINASNFLLVSSIDADGRPHGVSPDLANALASQLGVEAELRVYQGPGEVTDAVEEWDIGNIGAEPARAEKINFTAAYAEIESTYLVPGRSTVLSCAEIDRAGMRIAVKARAAYALWLERNLQHAELIQVDDIDESVRIFIDQDLDALAGLRPRLMSDVQNIQGGRVLDGQFSAVQQAIGTPKGRDPAGIDYLTVFVEEAKASGLVADLISKHEATGLSVAALAEG